MWELSTKVQKRHVGEQYEQKHTSSRLKPESKTGAGDGNGSTWEMLSNTVTLSTKTSESRNGEQAICQSKHKSSESAETYRNVRKPLLSTSDFWDSRDD